MAKCAREQRLLRHVAAALGAWGGRGQHEICMEGWGLSGGSRRQPHTSCSSCRLTP